MLDTAVQRGELGVVRFGDVDVVRLGKPRADFWIRLWASSMRGFGNGPPDPRRGIRVW